MEPFNFATKLLEGKNYQTLSLSKSIEVIIVKTFQKICDSLNNKEAKIIALRLSESIKKHLINKIKKPQQIATLVSLLF